MPLNVVVDASILVSAFLFPPSVPGQIMKAAEQNAFVLHLSPVLVEETRRSLLNPRLLKNHVHTEAAVNDWCSHLSRSGAVFPGAMPDVGAVCRDPDDDHVIAIGVATRADVIVTGDNDLLRLGRYNAIRIITRAHC